VPRRRADALVSDADEALRRVVRMVRESVVRASSGEDIAIRADTICIHGDGPHAAELARALREGLEREGIAVRSVGRR
jgi:UPF0271 protein